jgi:hypothetical protein
MSLGTSQAGAGQMTSGLQDVTHSRSVRRLPHDRHGEIINPRAPDHLIVIGQPPVTVTRKGEIFVFTLAIICMETQTQMPA